MNAHEHAMRMMISGWSGYAKAHHKAFASRIGDDYVLGPEWEAIGQALLGLLNGETGEMNCGNTDGAIRWALKENGCKDE